MTTILGAAASGLAHYSLVVDAAGNNVANINTAAFKRSRVLGQGSPSTSAEPGMPRMGVALSTVDVVHSSGAAYRDEDPLHFAIQDDSFFAVLHDDGSVLYTRYGALSADSEGNITAPGGRLLDPPLSLPEGSTAPAIDAGGVITALNAEGAREEIGRLTLVRFLNPQGLQEIGEGLYRETANSGPTIEGNPGDEGFGPIITGALEGSNVDLAGEFTSLLVAQRAYQACAKTFSVGDQMLALATDLTQ